LKNISFIKSPALLEETNLTLAKLKDGMSNLATNAASLGAVSTAAGATDSYVKSLETAFFVK
jgi:hypothetical protein